MSWGRSQWCIWWNGRRWDLRLLRTTESPLSTSMIKRNDVLTPSRTLFLTFDYLTIPSHIKAGYERIHVHQYIPAPRHCFKCQQFGHMQQFCHQTVAVCVTCGPFIHDGICESPPFCVNCHGNHASNQKGCPRYIEEHKYRKFMWRNEYRFMKQNVKFTTSNIPSTLVKSSILVNRKRVKVLKLVKHLRVHVL